MSTHKLFKTSILVLVVVAIGLVLMPASANASNVITCDNGPECFLCADQCQDGFICWDMICSAGSVSGCTPCGETRKHPLDFQKGIRHGEQGDKALFAQLLSKDPEISRALRSLE